MSPGKDHFSLCSILSCSVICVPGAVGKGGFTEETAEHLMQSPLLAGQGPWQEASPDFISGYGWRLDRPPKGGDFPCWSAQPSWCLQVRSPQCGADPQLTHPWGSGAQDSRGGRNPVPSKTDLGP